MFKEISGMCVLLKKVLFYGKNCKYYSEGLFFRIIYNGLCIFFIDNLEIEWKFFVFFCNKLYFILLYDRMLRMDRLEKNLM